MTRAKSGQISKNRHKKIIKMAKGYRGRARNCFRIAIERVERGLQYAYRDRRNKKRDLRALWIQRISAVTRQHGIVYSKFLNKIINLGIKIDRKMLSEIAVKHPENFKHIIQKVHNIH